jgi:hypothetical protein
MTTFTPSELRRIRALKTPAGIQRFIDAMPYHIGTTAFSPRVVMRERTAHCLEGAIFAAAALRVLGHRPRVLCLEAENDTDHVVAVFREAGGWGAIAASNYATCRGRSPVYRSLRELALSYFDGYFNLRRERTLRGYCRPIDLAIFDDREWMTTEKPVWFVVDRLFAQRYIPLITKKMRAALSTVDKRLFEAGLHGHRH